MNPELTTPQFAKGGSKPPPPNLRGTPLDLVIRDQLDEPDRLRSDGGGAYISGTDANEDGISDVDVLLLGAYIEARFDQGGHRRFLVGPGTDRDHGQSDEDFAAVLADPVDGCDANPCTGEGLIGGFTLWDQGNEELDNGFLGVTSDNSGLVTAAVTAAWEVANYRWHLKYGQDCSYSYDAAVSNRLVVSVVPDDAGDIAGWVVETVGPTPKAHLCRIPQRGKREAQHVGEFVAPVRLEFTKQTR
jgi:hypothetical protein